MPPHASLWPCEVVNACRCEVPSPACAPVSGLQRAPTGQENGAWEQAEERSGVPVLVAALTPDVGPIEEHDLGSLQTDSHPCLPKVALFISVAN